MDTQDYGPQPWVTDIEKLTQENDMFRATAWTGSHLQMTLMSIVVNGEVGLEKHDSTDQFLRIEQGKAKVVMGPSKELQNKEWVAEADSAIFVPSGTWHNIINIGDEPLKLYSIYAPAHHPHGTIHQTYEIAQEAEANEQHA